MIAVMSVGGKNFSAPLIWDCLLYAVYYWINHCYRVHDGSKYMDYLFNTLLRKYGGNSFDFVPWLLARKEDNFNLCLYPTKRKNNGSYYR
jgi:hypothetical protein